MCCCLLATAQARPSGHGSSDHKLVAVPDLSDFGGITYPHLDVIDLGETQKYVPEKEIKVVRTITITQPYPVKVPVKVPYPVPVVKEVPIEVTKVVKVPEPVHVDVVKSVQVHSSAVSEHVHGNGGLHDHWQPSASGHAETSHLSSDGHGEESNSEYQPNYHQSENYDGNEGHH